MKNACAIVTLSALLSACAVAPRQAGADRPVPAATSATATSATATATATAGADASPAGAAAPEEAGQAGLPKVALSADMMYLLLKAEFDLKAGLWQGPYDTMLTLARQSGDPRLARRAADIALAAHQAPEAAVASRLWRTLAPDSDEATLYHLGVAVLSDQLGDAEPIFARRLRESAPGTARSLAIFQTQQFLARAKDKAAAAALLERLMAPYDALAEAHVVLAQNAYTRGAAALAVTQARAALALRPDSEIAVLTLAQVTDDPAAVDTLLSRFIAANPGAREARTALARVLVERRQFGPARKQFEALLADQPDNLGTLYALGVMSMQLDEPAAAEGYLGHFIDVLAAHPDDERDPAKVLMLLAQLAEERRDFAGALRWLERIDAADQAAWFGAQLKRAELTGKRGEPDGALALLAGLAAEQPADQALVVLTQGRILRDADRIEAAYLALEAGTRRFPANPDLLYDFALLAEKTGRLAAMEIALRAVIAQAPDKHHAYNALGYSLAERNVRLPEALALIDKALTLAPDDPFIMDSMGWVQYRLGNLKQAEDYLRRAYALRGDVEIAVHLGEVLWRQGRQADAQALWRAARVKDPANDTLANTLARLQQSL